MRYLFLTSGFICLLLGTIGIVLPLLPTTPFVLLAAFCFSRSSKALHQKLCNNKLFGNLIYQWEQYGAIPYRAKYISSVMMLTMVSYPIFFGSHGPIINLLIIACITGSLLYIWSRPSTRNESIHVKSSQNQGVAH